MKWPAGVDASSVPRPSREDNVGLQWRRNDFCVLCDGHLLSRLDTVTSVAVQLLDRKEIAGNSIRTRAFTCKGFYYWPYDSDVIPNRVIFWLLFSF